MTGLFMQVLGVLVLSLVLAVLPKSAVAESLPPAPDLFAMSLEELMAVPVAIATRHDTALKYSPSTVHHFGREVLESLAIRNVYDLLNYVPGFHVTRTIDFADTVRFHIRGVDTGTNGYLLVMLNGVPLNEISLGRAQVYVPFIPVALLEKVEVITGPGAAVYGNNAYLGVLNMITRTTGTELNAAVGNRDSYEISGLFSSYLDDDKDWHISGGYYDYRDDGFNYTLQGNQRTRDPRSRRNLFATLRYKELRLDVGWSEARTEDFIQFAAVGNEINRFEVDTIYLKLSHDWQPATDWQVNSSFYYTRQEIDQLLRFGELTATDGITRDHLAGPYGRSEAFNGAVNVRYDLTAAQRFSFGVNFLRNGQAFAGINRNHDRIGPGQFVFFGGVQQVRHNPTFARQEAFYNTVSLYAQYEHMFNEQWRTTLGVRYDYYDLTNEHTVNPRVALIYTPTDSTTFKVIYGSAYRVPSSEEKVSRFADPDIRAETIQTAEVSVNQRIGHANLQVTYFYSVLNDLIEEQTTGTAESIVFRNAGDRTVSGLEAGALWDVTRNLRVRVNHTHIIQEIQETRFDDFSSFMAMYRQGRWSAAVHGTYRSAIDIAPFEEDEVFLAHAKVSYEVYRNVNLYVACQNLFDASYDDYVPALDPFGDSLPGRGRQYMLGIRYVPD